MKYRIKEYEHTLWKKYIVQYKYKFSPFWINDTIMKSTGFYVDFYHSDIDNAIERCKELKYFFEKPVVNFYSCSGEK